MDGLKEFATNWNEFWNGLKGFCESWGGFFEGCGNVFGFLRDCFTKEGFLLANLKAVAPVALLIFVGILVILKILGFKNSNKWIALAFILAILIAGL